MYQNLLIVDDEYDVLCWLEEMFKFNFDYEIGVYTAATATDALLLLDQVKFDVVLTDIHIPGMNGIALFEKIKDNWPRCKTVFLTGYRNFEDMRTLLKHKDVRLVLKNEEDEVIMQAVRDALKEVRQELEIVPLYKRSKEPVSEYLMRREFMNKLLKGEINSREMLEECAQRFQIPIQFSNRFLLFLIRIDAALEPEEKEFVEELELVKRLVRENIPEDIRIFLHGIEKRSGALLIQSQADQDKEWARVFVVAQGAVEYAQIIFKQKYDTSFSVVVSSTPIVYTELLNSMTRFRRIMAGYLGSEQEVIAHAERLEEEIDKGEAVNTAEKIPLLKASLESLRRQEYFRILTECCKPLSDQVSKHDIHAMEVYYSIAVLLIQYMNQNQLNEKIAFEIGIYKLMRVEDHGSWTEAAQYLFDVSAAIFKLVDDSEMVMSEKALKRVNEYIEANLAGDLSLTALADVGGFNVSYLSRLYKKVYKMNISDYIFQKRMELAASLLTTTNLKINDISVRTGYISAHSFARAFRNWSNGSSPVEYRNRYRK